MKEKGYDENIMDHYLVPLHILLNKEEEDEMLRKLDIKKSQIPKIKSSDPIIKHIGGRPGEVVKIVRKSDYLTISVAYRVIE